MVTDDAQLEGCGVSVSAPTTTTPTHATTTELYGHKPHGVNFWSTCRSKQLISDTFIDQIDTVTLFLTAGILVTHFQDSPRLVTLSS